mmetsp:Transcript_18011/g.32069  ORF Transcript_18011/g.32069 Transcript_18011/m.32069 type:complete len:87 (-) Transcript_18011:421-681(-)
MRDYWLQYFVAPFRGDIVPIPLFFTACAAARAAASSARRSSTTSSRPPTCKSTAGWDEVGAGATRVVEPTLDEEVPVEEPDLDISD